MKFDAKLLPLLGLLAIVAVLGLGISVIGMPMFNSVQNSEREISKVQQQKEALSLQLVQLEAAKARIGEIEAAIDELRTQIPATANSASVLLSVQNALEAHGAMPESITVGEPVPFAPRVGTDDEALANAAPPEPAEGGTEEELTPEETEAIVAAASDPREQFEITLVLKVADDATGTRLIDTLRIEPRLMLVTSAGYEPQPDTSDSGFNGKLTVALTAFTHTEKSQ